MSINHGELEGKTFFAGIFRDLRAEKAKTTELSENRKRLNAIIETAVDGIITIDKKGIIESANPAAARLFGYEANEMIGNNVRMLMADPHHSQHDQYLKNYLTTSVKKIIGIGREVPGLRKDGTSFLFKLSVSEVMLKDKHIFTGIVHDLSDRERAEAVEAALRKEKELNELKSRFVSIASHEFRTPLSTISTSASLINRYAKEEQLEKRQKHIKRIQSNVKHLTTILNDFLSLSKLEEGKITHQAMYFDLKEFCEEIKEEMETVAKENQKIVYEHIGDERIFLDKKLLTNILHNLLSNAIKYSQEGQTIYFKSKVENEELEIRVKDEGIGIPREEQKQIFQRFFRSKNAINIQGTGLGLNIVQKYTDLMGGSITFDSELNEGCEFTLILPNKFE